MHTWPGKKTPGSGACGHLAGRWDAGAPGRHGAGPSWVARRPCCPFRSWPGCWARRAALSRVLHGQDDRLIVVVGPCSIHDHDQAMEYARALKAQADLLGDDLLIVMRVYFEKPRTTVGWKGYINDPHLDGSFAINEGLEMARRLLLELLDLGLPLGTEFLDLLSPQFISDLVSWGAISSPSLMAKLPSRCGSLM